MGIVSSVQSLSAPQYHTGLWLKVRFNEPFCSMFSSAVITDSFVGVWCDSTTSFGNAASVAMNQTRAVSAVRNDTTLAIIPSTVSVMASGLAAASGR
jgi:hypothetical protein